MVEAAINQVVIHHQPEGTDPGAVEMAQWIKRSVTQAYGSQLGIFMKAGCGGEPAISELGKRPLASQAYQIGELQVK